MYQVTCMQILKSSHAQLFLLYTAANTTPRASRLCILHRAAPSPDTSARGRMLHQGNQGRVLTNPGRHNSRCRTPVCTASLAFASSSSCLRVVGGRQEMVPAAGHHFGRLHLAWRWPCSAAQMPTRINKIACLVTTACAVPKSMQA